MRILLAVCVAFSLGFCQDSTTAIARKLGLQGRVIWVDATANLSWTQHRDRVRDFVRNCREVGLNLIILDVKPISGHVIYPSQFAPKLTEWRGVTAPVDLDILAMFLEEAHAQNMPVHIALNVLSEGHRMFSVGPAYDKPEWQSVAYTGKRSLTLPGGARFDLDRFESEPPPDGISAYLRTAAPAPKGNGASRAYAVLSDDYRVQAVVDGAFITDPIAPPEGGWVLLADGKAAATFEQLASLGIAARLEVSPIFKPIADSDTEGFAVFVNPLLPEVRSRILGMIRELVENYPIDGIVMDRLRWANINVDFSETSRRLFEQRFGTDYRFPEDIITIPALPRQPVALGRKFGQWARFRSEVIRDLMSEIRATVKSVKDIPVGSYVGSWFSTYYDVGVNWSSDEIERAYGFVDGAFRFSSYLGRLDYLMPGCYYPIAYQADAAAQDADENRTVEASAKKAVELAANDIWVYASIYTQDYRDRPTEFEKAIRASIQNSHGVMIFDASMVNDWNWWSSIRRSLLGPTPEAPHDFPTLIESIRRSNQN